MSKPEITNNTSARNRILGNKQVARRHLKAKAFSLLCVTATWFGVALLVVLLADVVMDSSGWIANRVDKDPRMFALMLSSNPEFAERAEQIDPKLFKKLDAKIKAKQRRAESDGSALGERDLVDLELDMFHSQYSKDSEYFAQFNMNPSLGQRLSVMGSIIKDILAEFPSRHPSKAGIKSALVGSLWLLCCTALIAIPIGVAAALYLEEYAAKNRLNRFIEVNISNLAGVPSIVYGILGLAVFVRWLALGRSVIAGAATMSLLILPVIIIASREAIKAVPDSVRHGAFALGATRWQVVRHHVLPAAVPGILTGVILAMSRAIGETAPMIMIGALSYVAFVPQNPMDDFTVLPIQIFNWISMPQQEFHMLGASGILILLAVLMLMNLSAILIRHHAQRSLKW